MSDTIDRPRRSGGLAEVRAVIPERCYARPAGRAALAVAQGAALWAVPVVALLVLPAHWWSLVLVVLAGLGVAGLFVLGHDASHGALFAEPAVNRWVARAAMVPSLHNEAAWDLGHNRIHHGFTSRLGADFVWQPTTVDGYRSLSRLGRLRHRWEWSAFGAGAYYSRVVWWHKMMRFRPDGKRAAAYRRDAVALATTWIVWLLATVAVGLAQGGPARALWLVLATMVLPFVAFCQIIGWTVHVHHIGADVRWWRAEEWTQAHGQLDSTTILDMPVVLDALWFHHIFVHTPHHVDPRIAFHQLPEAAAAIEAAFPGRVRHQRWSLRGYLRDARTCKLYDPAGGSWLPYSAAR